MSQVSKFQKFFCSLFTRILLVLSMQKIREKDTNLQILVFTGVGLLLASLMRNNFQKTAVGCTATYYVKI